MDNAVLLLLLGFAVGTFGTLVGAGGAFILVPVLLLMDPFLPPEIITAISMAVVAANAISGSIAYARSGRIDFKAGIVFALFSIPGSIFAVSVTQYIPLPVFHTVFGVLLLLLAAFLVLKPAGRTNNPTVNYSYSSPLVGGAMISVAVGFLSALLGIGGGIIHVPALVRLLRFPVPVAIATSHFILAVIATVNVIVHAAHGNYDTPGVLHMTLLIGGGSIVGAQLGAFLSGRTNELFILRALAVCLVIVGVRLLV